MADQGTDSMTTSPNCAASRALPALARAPMAAACSSRRPGSRLKDSRTSWPAAANSRAALPPIRPAPITPIFMRSPLPKRLGQSLLTDTTLPCVSADQPPPAGPQDSVDRLLAGWARSRPGLDLSPVAVIARLDRLRRIMDSELEATFAEYGLNGPDFAALVTLRRLDEPGGVSQRHLMRELNLTSGTVS